MVTINHQTTYSVAQLFIRLVFWVRTVAFRFWDRLMSHVEPLLSFKTDVLTGDWFHRWRGTLTLTISEEDELRESLTKRNICKFKTQMRRHSRYFYSIAYDAKLPHGNLLEEILNIPNIEVAALFLQILVMEVQGWQLRKMIKEVNLLRYASTHFEILVKLERIHLNGLNVNSVVGFYNLEDREGSSTLHRLVGKNPNSVKQCLEQVLPGFEAWANIFGVYFILIETGILFLRYEDFFYPLLILVLKLMLHIVPLLNIKTVLVHRNNKKQTVFDVAAQVNSKSYYILVDTLNDISGTRIIRSSKLRAAEHVIGLIFLIFILISPSDRTFNSFLKWCLYQILVNGDLYCSRYFRYNFTEELFQGDNRDGNPLVGAMPEVIIEHLDEFLQEGTGNRFWQQQMYEILKTKPEFYNYLISNRYSDESRREIVEKLRQLNFSHPDYSSQIILDCSRVHVVAMAVGKNREDAAEEKQHFTQMCDKMGYTLYGPLDIGRSDEFAEMLVSTLGRIREEEENPELILIFIMAHGENDEILGCEGDAVRITDLINLAAQNTADNILKFMYFQTCRTKPEDLSQVLPEYNSISDSLGSCKNMYVHMATRPGDVAVRNTFIHYITHRLSLRSSLFIDPHDVSVTVNKECSSFFTAPQLYASPTMNVICAIRAPDHFH